MKAALKATFPATWPVMLGYVFAGIAFGLMFEQIGYNALWSFFCSTFVYAGSLQFLSVSFFSSGLALGQVALMTLLVNIRHAFYGISFLEPFGKMAKKHKWYMIFSLTDETYSLLCGVKGPESVDGERFMLSVALLDHCYWIIGCVLGSLVGALITFDITGVDFAMTALFIVIFVEQWLSGISRIPAVVGVAAALVSLLLFGPDNMVLPAMVGIVILLFALRKPLERDAAEKTAGSTPADLSGELLQNEDSRADKGKEEGL